MKNKFFELGELDESQYTRIDTGLCHSRAKIIVWEIPDYPHKHGCYYGMRVPLQRDDMKLVPRPGVMIELPDIMPKWYYSVQEQLVIDNTEHTTFSVRVLKLYRDGAPVYTKVFNKLSEKSIRKIALSMIQRCKSGDLQFLNWYYPEKAIPARFAVYDNKVWTSLQVCHDVLHPFSVKAGRNIPGSTDYEVAYFDLFETQVVGVPINGIENNIYKVPFTHHTLLASYDSIYTQQQYTRFGAQIAQYLNPHGAVDDHVIQTISNFFKRFGTEVKSLERDTEFMNNSFIDDDGVTHTYSITYMPQSDAFRADIDIK